MTTTAGDDVPARLAAALARGEGLDLAGAAVPGVVLARLLLAPTDAQDAHAPALRLTGAVVTGVLDLSYGEVRVPVHLRGCRLEEPMRLVGAATRTVELVDCDLPGLQARLADVKGDLRLVGSRVDGPVSLENAQVAGTLNLSRTRLAVPDGRALSAGGVAVGGGVVGRGLHADGEVRLIGARIGGGLLLDDAVTARPGGTSLCLDDVVTNRLVLTRVTCDGELRLRGAQVSGELNLYDARLLAPRSLRARGLVAGELTLVPARTGGLVDLTRARVGALRDSEPTWPARLRLDGFTYDHLLPVGRPVGVAARCRWLELDTEDYRPQPYEQLAESYRRLGHDTDARRVLLAKERRRRATLTLLPRVGGHLLDGLVGYGYRSWLAGLWLAVLVVVGTVVFSAVAPEAIDPDRAPYLTPFVYAVDLIVPIGAFGLRDTYDPVGWTRWVADGLIAAGWILATALVAGVSRRVGRD